MLCEKRHPIECRSPMTYRTVETHCLGINVSFCANTPVRTDETVLEEKSKRADILSNIRPHPIAICEENLLQFL